MAPCSEVIGGELIAGAPVVVDVPVWGGDAPEGAIARWCFNVSAFAAAAEVLAGLPEDAEVKVGGCLALGVDGAVTCGLDTLADSVEPSGPRH